MSQPEIRNMEEFAALSGLSRPTVSKYFNDPSSVRSSTRDKIEAALERYDYTPNVFAINQNRKLTKNVGIVVPNVTDPFFAEIARAIETRCIEAGLRPTLFSAHGDPEHEVEILESLRAMKPAGLLLAPLGRASHRSAVEKFAEAVPTVLFDSALPDLDLTFVGSDNPQFGALIVEYLCRTGEPPCFLELKTPANPNANKRKQAYLAAMERLGYEPHVLQLEGEGWDFEELGRSQGRRALQDRMFATNTVLCSNDRLAIGFLTACYEEGKKVGRESDADYRVAGQDDHPFSRFTCPPLTTVAQDYDAISRHSVETLLKTIGEDGTPSETKLFEGRLIMRESA